MGRKPLGGKGPGDFQNRKKTARLKGEGVGKVEVDGLVKKVESGQECGFNSVILRH